MTTEEFRRQMSEELRRGPSLQEKREAFYLLTPSPLILNDPKAYWRIRRRLLDEGKGG